MKMTLAIAAMALAPMAMAQSWFDQHRENEWRREQAYQMGEAQRQQRFAADETAMRDYWAQAQERSNRIDSGINSFQQQLREQDMHREQMQSLNRIEADLFSQSPYSNSEHGW